MKNLTCSYSKFSSAQKFVYQEFKPEDAHKLDADNPLLHGQTLDLNNLGSKNEKAEVRAEKADQSVRNEESKEVGTKLAGLDKFANLNNSGSEKPEGEKATDKPFDWNTLIAKADKVDPTAKVESAMKEKSANEQAANKSFDWNTLIAKANKLDPMKAVELAMKEKASKTRMAKNRRGSGSQA